MSGLRDEKIVEFPIASEERARRLKVEVERLASLPSAEQETRLADLAKRLDEDLDTLCVEFEAFVGTDVRDAEDIEPWPEPVDTRALLVEVMAQIRRYVVLHDDDAAVAMVLW